MFTPLMRNPSFLMIFRSRRYETLTFEKATPMDEAVARGRADGCGSGWIACGGTCGLWLCLGPCFWRCSLRRKSGLPYTRNSNFTRKRQNKHENQHFVKVVPAHKPGRQKKGSSRLRETCFFLCGRMLSKPVFL